MLIVAEGALHYVPFAALPFPETEMVGIADPDMLGMTRDIVRAPSASLLQSIRSNLSRRVHPSKMVAIFADPVFEATDPRLTAARGRSIPQGARPGPVETEGLQRLAFTRHEALEIARVVPEGGLLSLSGFDANREQATHSRLREFRVVHFATHALIRDARPELSGIVLSLFDSSGSSQDGHLRLHEIYNLDLPADLIVLSACQSALGSLMKGEGMIGLTRGFMYAGASSVLASLWKVHDEATAQLMAEFYKAMFREGMRPAAALRAAKARMARQRRWSHPYYWAGFVLHGDWR